MISDKNEMTIVQYTCKESRHSLNFCSRSIRVSARPRTWNTPVCDYKSLCF